MKDRLTLFLLLLLVVGGGLAIGYLTAPGEWYAQLLKPSFNPPGWVFGPVWTALYVLIAIAGWRLLRRHRDTWPMKLWWAQLLLNFLWSPVFFSAHEIGFALIVVLLLLGTIIGLVATSYRHDRIVAWLMSPYLLWVGYASVLNAAIFALNHST